ncbi:hypothetical protein HU200_065655 [Digitaria exilis]|uniref:Uncharacterized protein n=1 Tax=Digitaria exilis TaxID=1010633 RepID=A0A835A3L6_9POAL|nr:hypothetical protein HU200_065655 [Digitaria exilis]
MNAREPCSGGAAHVAARSSLRRRLQQLQEDHR